MTKRGRGPWLLLCTLAAACSQASPEGDIGRATSAKRQGKVLEQSGTGGGQARKEPDSKRAGMEQPAVAGDVVASKPSGHEPGKSRASVRKSTQSGSKGWHKAVPRPSQSNKVENIEGFFEWEWKRLTYPTGTFPRGDWRGRAMRHTSKLGKGAPSGFSTISIGSGKGTQEGANPKNGLTPGIDAVITPTAMWTEMGPKPLDSLGTTNNAYQYGIVAGRTNTVVFQPGSTSIAYIGAVVGGLWKTTNCCSASTTWTALWDNDTFPAQSVSAIAIDPVNPNIIYAGTGDSHVPAYDMFGNGIYKSTDAGTSWIQYGANVLSPYSSVGAPGTACCNLAPDENIDVIAINPLNTNTIVAAASYGVFISYDAGLTWTQYDVVPRTAPYATTAQRVTGLLLDGNTNPATMYVALGYPYSSSLRPGLIGGANGVYRAPVPASGAPTFTLIANGWPAGTANGGTTSNVGRIELAWNAAHTRIYAHVGKYSAAVGETLGIYHTGNPLAATPTWNLLTGTAEASWADCSNANETDQAWYDLHLAVDPLDDKILYTGRTNLWRATVNAGYTGVTLLDLSGVYGTTCPQYGTMHPDQHAFDFQPGSNPTAFVAANDGGVYYGADGADANTTLDPGEFTQLNNGISTNQFYGGQISADFAGGVKQQWLFGGMQDNGNATWDSTQSNKQWIGRSVGGDGFHTAFDVLGGTLTGGRWVTEYTNGALDCSSTGADGPFAGCGPAYGAAERQDWSTPFILDQWNCDASPATCGNTVLGSTTVWASINLAAAWTKTSTLDLTKGGNATIISINVAHNNPGSVIVGTTDGNFQWSNNVFTGASCTAAAANTAAFACTANGAATWVNLTGANAVLPNRAIPGVVFDPATNTRFYAAIHGFNTNTPATPGHIFMGNCSASPCTTGNITWTDKSGIGADSLPDIPFESVQVNPNNVNQVFAGSYLGFYYTDDISLADPVWKRWQSGMPNTRISHLVVDRGPDSSPRASTTLAAYTYGRGVYLAQINLPCGNTPTGTTAAPNGNNRIDVSWTTTGSPQYKIYRSLSATGPFTFLGTAAAPPFADNTVSSGITYYYVVRGSTVAPPVCDSLDSAVASAVAGGLCDLPPTFAGLSSASNAYVTPCGINLSWTAASSPCGGAITYSVFRSTTSGFTPTLANRIATGITGTSFADNSNLANGTTYYYKVRASVSGITDANTAEASARPTGTQGAFTTVFQDNFDCTRPAAGNSWWLQFAPGGGPSGDNIAIGSSPGWSTCYSSNACGSPAAASARWAQNSTTACTTDYPDGDGDAIILGGNGAGGVNGIAVAAGAENVRLKFKHTYQIEMGWDGGYLQYSTTASTGPWTSVTCTASGTAPYILNANACYNGTTDNGAGVPAWMGTSVRGDGGPVSYPTFNEVTVHADALAGTTVWWRWQFYSDANTVGDGYWLDDVRMEFNQAPASCGTVSSPLLALTVTAKDGSNKVEWVNPPSSYGSTRVRFRTDTFPTGPADGTLLIDQTGTAGAASSFTHNSLTNGTTYYYGAFVNNGAGLYSSIRSARGTPEVATGAVRWKFNTPATAMSPPTINSAIYNVSNDRFLHSMNLNAVGGDWPRTAPKDWKPLAMNAPSQAWSPVWNASIGGATRVTVVPSQDGRIYCVNADTGALIWTSPLLGDVLQSLPGAYFAAWDTNAVKLTTNMIFVATRNSTTPNKLHALNAATGTILWTFDNGGVADETLAIGVTNGGIVSDATARRLWFATRKRGTGTANTLWALDYTETGATVGWAAAAGDIDSVPIRRGTRLLVGNNAGAAKAFNAYGATATQLWTLSMGDGPVKTIIMPDFAGTKLFFSTTTRVWALDDTNGTQAGLTNPWSTPASGAGSIASPSRPVLVSGKLYVGSGSGSIVTLDLATTPPNQTVRSLGVAAIGPPVFDYNNNWVHAGTEAGVVYCIAP